MNLKILIIHDYKILFEILDEIKEILNFKIIKSEKEIFQFLDIQIHKKNLCKKERGY